MAKSRKSGGHIGFLSFFKLSLVYGLAVGQLAGVGCVVGGICGFPVTLDLGACKLQGLPAGLGMLVLLPLLSGLLGLLLAPVLYAPFTLASWVLGGISGSES